MKFCTRCGHELGVGRFCTNCGLPVDQSPTPAPAAPTPPPVPEPVLEPVLEPTPEPTPEPIPEPVIALDDDWRTDTAERTVGPVIAKPSPSPFLPGGPRTPPTAQAPPPAPRFPLYADEVEPATLPRIAPTAESSVYEDLFAEPATGTFPAIQPDLEPLVDEPGPPVQDYDTDESQDLDALTPYPLATTDETPHRPRWAWLVAAAALVTVLVVGALQLTGGGNGTSNADDGKGPAAKAKDVTSSASASAPETAPANEDVDGNSVSYDASNMLDGVPDTAWRMPGNGKKTVLTFSFEKPVTLTGVGLVNGYAKKATDDQGRVFDWYHGGRKILAVQWVFSDGTMVTQKLDDSRELQAITIDPVTTSEVRLKLVRVSKPGEGRASRDYTAVSDVQFLSAP